MTDRSENEMREAGDILGLKIDEQHHPEEVTARLFLVLARGYQTLDLEVETLMLPLGTPAERSSLQQAEEQADGPPEENCGCCNFRREDNCRYMPPCVVSEEGAYPGMYWPEIILTGWCGRFLRKPAVLP